MFNDLPGSCVRARHAGCAKLWRREVTDRGLLKAFAAKIREQYPRCPPERNGASF